MTRNSLTALFIFFSLAAGGQALAEPENAPAASEVAPAAPAVEPSPAVDPGAPVTEAAAPAVAEPASTAAAPAAGEAPAAEPAPADRAAEAAKPKQDDGLVCRMEKPIGSNRMKRVCRPAADIEDTARRTQDAMRHMQRSGPNAQGR
jgi:hypothetical protein